MIVMFFMLLLVILGFFIGFIVSMIGLAGGVFFIPLLVLVYGFNPASAVGVSLFAMTGVTLASSIGYFLRGKVDVKLSLLYDFFDIPGVVLGAWLTVLLSSNILLFSCGLVILIMGFALLFYEYLKVNVKSRKGWGLKEYFLSSVSSLFSGLITGLTGMGGGTTDTTTMILLGVPVATAVASSEFAMLLTNLFGLFVHGFLGNIDYLFAFPLFAGALLGALSGAHYSSKVKTKTLRRVLAVFVFFLGLRLIIV